MMNYIVKLHNMYYSEGLFKRATFSHELSDATFFKSIDDAVVSMKERNLPEYCKIMQVTYVEHDIGYVEHTPLVK